MGVTNLKNNLFGYGITFNGHHSSELGLDVLTKDIAFPSKVKILQRIPHSNTIYDFSEIAGEQFYDEREFTIVFNIVDRLRWDKEGMYALWTKALAWLLEPNKKTELLDDVMKNYYYLAEVQSAPTFDEFKKRGALEVVFKCYPYRLYKYYEGHDEFDEFNFETDIAQLCKYRVRGSRNFSLINSSVKRVEAVVFSKGVGQLTVNGTSYTLTDNSQGTTIILSKGTNGLKATGSGTLEIRFRKEVY